MDLETQIEDLRRRQNEAEAFIKNLDVKLNNVQDVANSNADVLFGNQRARRSGLLEMVPLLQNELRANQEQIQRLIEKMERAEGEKAAVKGAQDEMWNKIKLYGGVASALLGLSQLINIIINLTP